MARRTRHQFLARPGWQRAQRCRVGLGGYSRAPAAVAAGCQSAVAAACWWTPLRLLVLLLGIVAAHLASAQDIEPRAYSNAPVGVNFLIAGYAYTAGAVPFDSALPIRNAEMRTSNAVLAYARVLDLAGMSAKFDAIVPYSWLSGHAELRGQPIERIVDGLADPRFRLSVNLYGAPALSLPEFRNYEQDLIIGASLQVSAPAGQYDPTRVVNIGTNRWSFKPEIGISKVLGRWTLESQAAVTVFTDNRDFHEGNRRRQDPLYSLQGHAIYSFPRGIWASLDFTYFTGGRTTIDGVQSSDLQQNWRLGATLALPVDVHNSVKLYASSGVASRTGCYVPPYSSLSVPSYSGV
ncbi:transporter, partial [Accumulibacter sp.]|uniref:transporter n=1 Tax=Accumulibacter sp. TaxID=2053492 RepID=UPI0025D1D957